jgi:hypothetical protein
MLQSSNAVMLTSSTNSVSLRPNLGESPILTLLSYSHLGLGAIYAPRHQQDETTAYRSKERHSKTPHPLPHT